MALKRNLEYWQISLKNPEPAADEYYIFDEVIIEDKELIWKVERLRELIIGKFINRLTNTLLWW